MARRSFSPTRIDVVSRRSVTPDEGPKDETGSGISFTLTLAILGLTGPGSPVNLRAADDAPSWCGPISS